MLEYEKLELLTDGFKAYIKTNVELIKLEMIERISIVGSNLMATMVIAIFTGFSMLFISLSAALYISEQLGNSYIGFTIIGAAYLLAALLLFVGRKKLIERPIRNKIIEKILGQPTA